MTTTISEHDAQMIINASKIKPIKHRAALGRQLSHDPGCPAEGYYTGSGYQVSYTPVWEDWKLLPHNCCISSVPKQATCCRSRGPNMQTWLLGELNLSLRLCKLLWSSPKQLPELGGIHQLCSLAVNKGIWRERRKPHMLDNCMTQIPKQVLQRTFVANNNNLFFHLHCLFLSRCFLLKVSSLCHWTGGCLSSPSSRPRFAFSPSAWARGVCRVLPFVTARSSCKRRGPWCSRSRLNVQNHHTALQSYPYN